MDEDYDIEKAKVEHEKQQKAAWALHRATVTDTERELAAEIVTALLPQKI